MPVGPENVKSGNVLRLAALAMKPCWIVAVTLVSARRKEFTQIT